MREGVRDPTTSTTWKHGVEITTEGCEIRRWKHWEEDNKLDNKETDKMSKHRSWRK